MKKTTLMALCLAASLTAAAQGAKIKTVTPVAVTTQAGQVPMLPYRLWVTYSDGRGEYRQVKWMNSSLETEQEAADATKHPAGSAYDVQGYIIGDNKTAAGYPITARVSVVAAGTPAPQPTPQAEPLPLGNVQLIGNNRLTHNRDLDIDNLLSLDPRQQVYNYRDTYGLPTEGYHVSDGWD